MGAIHCYMVTTYQIGNMVLKNESQKNSQSAYNFIG